MFLTKCWLSFQLCQIRKMKSNFALNLVCHWMGSKSAASWTKNGNKHFRLRIRCMGGTMFPWHQFNFSHKFQDEEVTLIIAMFLKQSLRQAILRSCPETTVVWGNKRWWRDSIHAGRCNELRRSSYVIHESIISCLHTPARVCALQLSLFRDNSCDFFVCVSR